MKQFRNNVIRAGLGALYFTGAHYLLRPIFSGVGAIFMLHHVRPRRDAEFQPNRHLEVAPEFLRAMLAHLRSRDVDIVTMDEVHRRLIERNFSRRFACFTLDDGYRDNRDFALPVMREFDAPLTMYVASDFAEGIGRLWWIALEMAIARASSIEVTIGGVATRLDTSGTAARPAAFDRLHDWLRSLPGEHDIEREIAALCARHGVDEAAICRELCMSWDELKPFADDPLVSVGAHSITHCNLARQSEEIASSEMAISRARIENVLQRPVVHLAYPYGDKDAAGPANSRWRARPDTRPR
jgi:peptidoglycan/xylan/chitin deacetylase (PgdA/CDA1 family)